jgi:predicted AAA+ superfamily ATPase
LVDLVDQETAEVHQVDGLQHLLITRYARSEDFITETTSLIEGIFRLLLANGNSPLTPEELADRLGRPPRTILQTLSGPRVYKGMRPLPT